MHLTRSGRARFTEIGKKLEAAEREALSVFSAGERNELRELLLRLIDHLG